MKHFWLSFGLTEKPHQRAALLQELAVVQEELRTNYALSGEEAADMYLRITELEDQLRGLGPLSDRDRELMPPPEQLKQAN
jgi:hypothetical protein